MCQFWAQKALAEFVLGFTMLSEDFKLVQPAYWQFCQLGAILVHSRPVGTFTRQLDFTVISFPLLKQFVGQMEYQM